MADYLLDACIAGNMDGDECADLLARYVDEANLDGLTEDVKSLLHDGILDFLAKRADELSVWPSPSDPATGNNNLRIQAIHDAKFHQNLLMHNQSKI